MKQGPAASASAKPEGNRKLALEPWLFVAPFVVSFIGLGFVFVGLIARHNKSSAHWGIWCSIFGWSLAFAGVALRPLANRLAKKLRE